MLNDHPGEQDRIHKVLKTKTNDLFTKALSERIQIKMEEKDQI